MSVIGISAKLEIQIGSTWTEVPSKKVNLPAYAIAAVEDTNLGNVDFHKTFFPGTIDPGTVGADVPFSDANWDLLAGQLREVFSLRISTSEAKVVTFNDAFITKLEAPFDSSDSQAMIAVEFKLSGAAAS